MFAEFGFGEPRDGEIEVIATKEEVFAYGGAREIDLVAFARNADEREVAGTAAHVADEDDLAIEEEAAGSREIVGDPGIERGGGLFEEREARETGFLRRFNGQFAGFFIERCGDGEDHVVIAAFDRRNRLSYHLFPYLLKEARGSFDGR